MSVTRYVADGAGLSSDAEKLIDQLCEMPAVQRVCDYAEEQRELAETLQERVEELRQELKEERGEA